MSRLAEELSASQELSFINSLTKLITFSSARPVSRLTLTVTRDFMSQTERHLFADSNLLPSGLPLFAKRHQLWLQAYTRVANGQAIQLHNL